MREWHIPSLRLPHPFAPCCEGCKENLNGKKSWQIAAGLWRCEDCTDPKKKGEA